MSHLQFACTRLHSNWSLVKTKGCPSNHEKRVNCYEEYLVLTKISLNASVVGEYRSVQKSRYITRWIFGRPTYFFHCTPENRGFAALFSPSSTCRDLPLQRWSARTCWLHRSRQSNFGTSLHHYGCFGRIDEGAVA